MKIFVTGASGFIGSAVAMALSSAGHSVFGLVRSPEKGLGLAAAEIAPVVGSIANPETFVDLAQSCAVVVHCAMEHSPDSMEIDRRLIQALTRAAMDAKQPSLFLYTSSVWVYGDTGDGVADETAPLHPPTPGSAARAENEQLVLAANKDQLRTLIIRPACIYGGAGSLTAAWFESAVKEGAARIVGDGNFRWSMAHVQDLANLYLRAAESPWRGEIFNASDRSRFTVLESARAASAAAGAGGNVATISVEEAVKTMGVYAKGLVLNQHVDSSKAVRMLGWQPRHGGFVDGVARYFTSWKAANGL